MNMNRVAPENIGFGVVNRRFRSGAKTFMAGDELPREFLLAMPQSNRDAMEDSKQIKIYPRKVISRSLAASSSAGAEPAITGELYLRATGVDEYDVIRGEIVATRLTKEAAQAVVAAGVSVAQPSQTGAQDGSPDATTGAPARTKRAASKRKGKKGKRKSSVRRAAAPKEQPQPTAGPQENGPIE